MISQKIFKKPLFSITKEDVEAFFKTAQLESSVLEFKSGGVQIRDVLKEIAAFANTEGGLLIIGTPKETKRTLDKHEDSVCLGELDLCKSIRNKESLMQQVATGILPFPQGILIHEVLSTEGNIFFIEVPQSISPPHQVAGEGRYYVRIEKNSVPASHAIVKALFFKTRSPVLHVSIAVAKALDAHRCVITIDNASKFPAENVGLHVELYGVNDVKDDTQHFTPRTINNQLKSIHSAYVNKGILFPGMKDVKHTLIVEGRNAPYVVKITCWCSGAESKTKFWRCDPETHDIKEYNLQSEEDILDLQSYIATEELPIKLD
ncbi:AlbA family DNA-binding domain-containing protein [Chryseosolibacter indicus]|uniref:DNA binding domain-containing protein n=1 Tax=Chryseosolibacter indicus TaxID=2782351 RepID=A0ABS5VPG6_9BACT|nr:ATP-binding protein [Chryseosolibacter indicus]MBT1703236.1 putative DNA binding domain-containing protein [Chryseosolibacter indicus]